MAIAGAIAERTRGVLPITWDALLGDSRYGESLLQAVINTAKETVFGTVAAPAAESAYSLLAIDYTAKLAALQLIPAGIDFWMNQPMEEVAEGTNETHTFTDRAEALRKLSEALLKETRALQDVVEEITGFTRVTGGPRPLLNTIEDELLTPSPQEFPRPYSVTDRS